MRIELSVKDFLKEISKVLRNRGRWQDNPVSQEVTNSNIHSNEKESDRRYDCFTCNDRSFWWCL